MENDIILAINDLETTLYIILAIVIIGLLFILFLGYKVTAKLSRVKASDKFQFFAQEQMDKGCYEDLVTYALDFLKDRPHHTYAQWYLAKAYYNLEDYENAKKYFEKIAQRELEWRDNVMPYLDEINDNL